MKDSIKIRKDLFELYIIRKEVMGKNSSRGGRKHYGVLSRGKASIEVGFRAPHSTGKQETRGVEDATER